MREDSGVSDESLERRLTAVEAEVVEVRREAAAARALASGADRDVADYRAEMRAHTRGLDALRQTQTEHYAEHRAEFARLGSELDRVNTGLGRVEAGMQYIVRLLEEPGGRPGARPAGS
jgi:hypothetical protein